MQDLKAAAVDAAAMTPVLPNLSIVVPTYNEAANVPLLIAKLEDALAGHSWEIVFVDDDSADDTSGAVARAGADKPYIRCIRRIGRRGLSSAVIEGALSCDSPYIAVMDADLQHDERILPDMLRMLNRGDVDLAIGSRYVGGGGVGEWSRMRQGLSRFATVLSRLVVSAALRDPMSGYFMMRRGAFHAALSHLSGRGYKIMLDLLASSPQPLRFVEVPYEFQPRLHGESKLSLRVLYEYAVMIFRKRLERAFASRARAPAASR